MGWWVAVYARATATQVNLSMIEILVIFYRQLARRGEDLSATPTAQRARQESLVDGDLRREYNAPRPEQRADRRPLLAHRPVGDVADAALLVSDSRRISSLDSRRISLNVRRAGTADRRVRYQTEIAAAEVRQAPPQSNTANQQSNTGNPSQREEEFYGQGFNNKSR